MTFLMAGLWVTCREKAVIYLYRTLQRCYFFLRVFFIWIKLFFHLSLFWHALPFAQSKFYGQFKKSKRKTKPQIFNINADTTVAIMAQDGQYLEEEENPNTTCDWILGKTDKKAWLGSCEGVTSVMIPGAKIKVLSLWSWDTASLLSQRVVCDSQCEHFFILFFLFCDNEKMFKLPSLCLNTSSCWQQLGEPLISCQTEKCNFFGKVNSMFASGK